MRWLSNQFVILIEATADAAFAVDAAGRTSAWNNAAAELFGVSEAEAIGVKCHQMLQCSDENGVVCSEHCVIEFAAQGNFPRMNFDLRVHTKTGKLWCNFSTFLANDASGARHAVHIVRPCEMRKRLEQALSEFVRMQASPAPNGVPRISSTPAQDINVPLTARETEVLKRLAKGNSTRTIANQLNISSATVNNHIKHILTKLDAHTRLEAIRHAESAGMI
jgi:PAS domain S-box-containing protein